MKTPQEMRHEAYRPELKRGLEPKYDRHMSE